ncbi:MAG: FIST C-terminal domain-containing protein [Spirochaetaceae bacterium]|nr:FIST C-terminal domain-containing protein [Spirochaetaceae bacterium]
MIKMLTACTEEVDEADDAVDEILGQLGPVSNLAANSLGIINCDPEFVESGVVEELAKRLPFDTVGVTTRAGAARGVFGSALLSLSVLTADDVNFSIARSETITADNTDEAFASAYNSAAGGLPEKPVFALCYPPIIVPIGSYAMTSAVFKAAGGTPVFGTLSCSPFADHSNNLTIMNGTADGSSAVLALISGNIHPDFCMVSIPEQNIQRQYGIITKSEGCLVYKINDMSVPAYLERQGFPHSSINQDSLYLIPFMVGSENPTASALYGITDEGVAIFGSEMPEGKEISPCSLNYNGIMETTEKLLRKISLKKNINGILFYSCLVRQVLLGAKNDDELKKVIEKVDGIVPYQICYSGGEICPVNEDGGLKNGIHNYTLIACIF